MKVLAVGAHPDDVELGCGGTLALLKKKGHQVYVLILTKGEASGDPVVRENECKQAIATIGVDELFLLNLPDTKITDGIETIMAIENVISKVTPQIIFTHSPRDVHQDHRNTYLASMSAARRVRTVLLYESPAALSGGFSPQAFVDITPSMDLKMKALEVYNSQAAKPYMNGHNQPTDPCRNCDNYGRVSSAISGLARFRGFQAGLPLAEAFEVAKYLVDI